MKLFGQSQLIKCRFSPVLIMVFALLNTSGCSKRGEVANRLPVHPVKGVVQYQGKPVARAEVTFVPVGGGDASIGTTGTDGQYVLSSFKPQDGAPLGVFKVVVMVPLAGAAVPGFEHLAKSQIPSIYTNREKTPLTAEVKEGNNVLNFELKD